MSADGQKLYACRNKDARENKIIYCNMHKVGNTSKKEMFQYTIQEQEPYILSTFRITYNAVLR